MRGILRGRGRADNLAMRLVRHALSAHALLFGYALLVLCAMLLVGGVPGF
jgi:hypothetical protein